MSSHLERFVQDHRDQFDDESPAPELWDKIRDRMQGAEVKAGEKKEAPVRSLSIKRWLSAAAAVVLVCASGWLYFSHRQKPAPPPLAINQQPQAADTDQRAATIAASIDAIARGEVSVEPFAARALHPDQQLHEPASGRLPSAAGSVMSIFTAAQR